MTNQSQPSRRSAVPWVASACVAVALAGGGVGGWYYIHHPPRGKYRPILDAVAAGRIGASTAHPVDLPADLHGITPRDQILYNVRDDKSYVIAFPTSYDGNGLGLVGLMYTSRPLAEADTFANRGAVAFSRRDVRCGSYDRMALGDRIDDHWYHVSYGIQK